MTRDVRRVDAVADSTTTMDTGVRLDSGVSVDSGVRIDTGVAVDTGVIVDTSVAVDSGVVIDTGVIVDTGVPMPGTSPAGGLCRSTADCITGLRCDTSVLRGFCFGDCVNSLSQTEEQRQCFGVAIDLAVTSTCPDGPATPVLSQTRDNLAYCVFRTCTARACCPAGMVCEGTGGSGFCSVDDPTQPNIPCI